MRRNSRENKHLERQGTNDSEEKYKLKGNKLLKNDSTKKGRKMYSQGKIAEAGRKGWRLNVGRYEQSDKILCEKMQ